MTITVFGLFTAALGLWCQFGHIRRTIIAMFALVVLGAASALDLPALGGASVTPANFFLLFYLLRLVSTRGGLAALVAAIGPRRPLFPFLLLVMWIFGSALLLPRLFEGATQVFSLARSLDTDTGTVPLHPTSGNISQAVYAAGGLAMACATCAYAGKPGGRAALLIAITVLTGVHLAFAILDLVTAATHTGYILDLVHTASYAFLTDDEVGGLKRISGSFTEASSFATFSLILLAVNVPLFVGRVRSRFTGPASALLACFVVLSTSSAGYAGLGVFGAGFLLTALVSGVFLRRRRIVAIAVTAAGGGLFLVSLIVLFLPGVAATASAVISESVLNKGTSESAIERGTWNAQALQVFHDTHWLGAGIGSTRGSNYVLVLLSNLGAIGLALFALLVLRLVLSRLSPAVTGADRTLVWAARIGVATALVPNLLVGTVYDLGTLFYGLAGIAASGISASESVTSGSAARNIRDPAATARTIAQAPAAHNASFRSRA